MRLRARHRFRVALVVILCLLFQQAALAAYACPLESMPAKPVAMAEACAEMGMEQVRDVPALCHKHCVPDLSVAADHATLAVPAVALPPPVFEVVLVQSAPHTVMLSRVPVSLSDPPPRLRFCSLLI